MRAEELRKLHAHLLSALLEVDRICRAHGIKYFITGGTMLGAVRHKGFIPWDDDLDVGLRRDEYEKFLSAAKDELDDGFFLQTNRTDPEYSLPYCKLRVNGTKFMNVGDRRQNIHHGAFIDVFPMDAAPAGKLARLAHGNTVYFLKMALLARSRFDPQGTVSGSRMPLFKALRLLLRPFRLGTLMRWTERAMRMFGGRRTGWAVNLCGTYGYKREVVPVAFLEEYVLVPFEGHEVYTMKNWDAYLTQIYGNYMQPPPEDKRSTGHEPVELEL